MTAIPAKPRLYGRRKGRPLRARKAHLMEGLLSHVQIPEPMPGAALDPRTLFPFRANHIWLEIGFGGGEHMAGQAKRHPDTGFIGCEPFINGIANLLDKIDKDKLRNIRVFPGDARLLMDRFPEKSVARGFLLFPDPWPKARHAERRFINAATLGQLARIMQAGAELRLASDDPGMILWFREMIPASPAFVCESDSPAPPADWIETRYEQKALKAGRQPAYMIYRRK